MAWLFQLDFQDGNGWRDITSSVLFETLKKDEQLHSELQPVQNQLSFSIHRNTTIANLLMGSTEDVLISVGDSGADYFSGVLQPDFSLSLTANVGPIQVKAVDNGEKLRLTADTLQKWISYDVCDTGDTSASIVHQTLILAGYSDTEWDISTSIAKTLPAFAIIDAEKRSYWDILAGLLFEYGYTFNFGADGKFRLVELFPDTVPSAQEFATGSAGNVIGELKVTRSGRKYLAVEVQWSPTQTLTDVVVFDDTTGGDATRACFIPLAADGDTDGDDYYPIGSGDFDVYSEYRVAEGELVVVNNAVLRWRGGFGIANEEFTDRYLRAVVRFHNDDTITRYLRRFRIRGDAIVRTGKRLTRSEIVAGTQKVRTVSTRHLRTTADAQFLATGIRKYYQYSEIVLEWRSRVSVDIDTIANVVDSSLGIDEDVRIVRKVYLERMEEYLYQGELITAYSADTTSTEGSLTMPPVNQTTAGSSDINGPWDGDTDPYTYFGWDDVPEYAELFDLRSPDAISSEGRVPTSRYKKFIPGKVNDETGTPILSPWSKFTGLGAMAFTRATTNVLLDPEDLTASNWASVNTASASLSAKKFGSSFWSLVTNGAASTGYMRQIIAASTFSVHAYHRLTFMAKKGTAAVTRFQYRDTTASADRAYLTITWATQAITVTTGTFLAAFWWVANDTVEIMVQAAICTNGNVHQYRCFGSDAATSGESTYWTRLMAADIADAAAIYTPTRRAQSRVIYPYPTNGSLLAGKISCWVMALFVYNCASDQYAWCIGDNAVNNTINLRYDFATDKWIAQTRVGASDYRQAISTAAWTDNANLGVWRYFEVEWDASAQTITLTENGTAQTGTGSAGTVTGLAFANEDLRIGARGATDLTQLDGLIHDLLLEPLG